MKVVKKQSNFKSCSIRKPALNDQRIALLRYWLGNLVFWLQEKE